MEQRNFGDILRNERKRKGLTLIQAAERLRIRPDILQAIENSDIPNMPPHCYSRNMVMGYAKFMGLDPDRLADLLNDEYARFQAATGGAHPHSEPREHERQAIREPRAARRAREAREGYPPAGASGVEATQRMSPVPVDGNMHGYDDRADVPRSRYYEHDDADRYDSRYDDGYGDQPYEDDYQDYEGDRGPLAFITDGISSLVARFNEGGTARNNMLLGIVAAVLALVIVIVLIFNFGCSGNDKADQKTEQTKTEQTQEKEKEAPKAPTSMKFEYKVDEGAKAWVEIYVDGEQKLAEEVTGEKKGSFDVTGEINFVTATSEGVHVYIDGEEQKLETNEGGLVDVTYTFEDFLNDWKEKNGISTSDSSSSDGSSSDSSASDSGSSTDSASTNAGSTDTGAAASDVSSTDTGAAAPVTDQATVDTGSVDTGYVEDQSTEGSATTGGY